MTGSASLRQPEVGYRSRVKVLSRLSVCTVGFIVLALLALVSNSPGRNHGNWNGNNTRRSLRAAPAGGDAAKEVNSGSRERPEGVPPAMSFEGRLSRKLLDEEDYSGCLDCVEVHLVDADERCAFVSGCPDCTQDNKFFNYAGFVYCTFPTGFYWAGTIILVLWWLFLFVGLAVTADDFFCPSLVVISKVLRISPNIAGVTFLAFGNGSPDVFSAIAALGAGGNPSLGLGGLLGAGVFVTTVVAGTISVITPFKAMERPFIRDVIFYIWGVWFTFYVLWVGKIYLWQAILYIVAYFVYVTVVASSGSIYKKQQAKKQAKQALKKDSALQKSIEQLDLDFTDSDLDDNKKKGGRGMLTRELSIVAEMSKLGEDEQNAGKPLTSLEEDEDEQEENNGNGVNNWYPEDDVADEDVATQQPLSPYKELLLAINPINMEEWGDMKIYAKAFEIFKCPAVFILVLTCPVVNYEVEGTFNWCRLLNIAQLFIAPTVAAFVTRLALVWIGPIPIVAVTLVLGCGLAVAGWMTSRYDEKPTYHDAFGFLGFLMGIIWIYTIANEIIALLKVFGVVLNIDSAILGLTLLAWGNSIGDWISDTVMARQGFARMGFSACFGGPFFNLCLGFGIPMLLSMVQDGTTVRKLEMSTVVLILCGFLLGSLCFSLVFMNILKFNVRKIYGLCLLIIYLTFVTCAVLAQLDLLLPGWKPF